MKQLSVLLMLAVSLCGCNTKRKAIKSEDATELVSTSVERRDSISRIYHVDSLYCVTDTLSYVKTVYRPDTAKDGRQLIEYSISVSKASKGHGKVAKRSQQDALAISSTKVDSISAVRSSTIKEAKTDARAIGWSFWLIIILAILVTMAYIIRKIK